MEITREENTKWKAIKIIIHQKNVKPWKSTTGPFEILVRTIISQNTNDRNTAKATELLKRNIGIDPNSILTASKENIIECLKPAGLYNVKAPRIINLAKILKEELKDPNKISDMTCFHHKVDVACTEACFHSSHELSDCVNRSCFIFHKLSSRIKIPAIQYYVCTDRMIQKDVVS